MNHGGGLLLLAGMEIPAVDFGGGLKNCLAELGWETIKLWEDAGNQMMGVFERR